MRTLIVASLLAFAALAVVPSVTATQPLGCGADLGPCVWHDASGATCAGVAVGLQGAYACADADPASVRACTSLYSSQWGYCPTDVTLG
jgi:hypothetical protein